MFLMLVTGILLALDMIIITIGIMGTYASNRLILEIVKRQEAGSYAKKLRQVSKLFKQILNLLLRVFAAVATRVFLSSTQLLSSRPQIW